MIVVVVMVVVVGYNTHIYIEHDCAYKSLNCIFYVILVLHFVEQIFMKLTLSQWDVHMKSIIRTKLQASDAMVIVYGEMLLRVGGYRYRHFTCESLYVSIPRDWIRSSLSQRAGW